MKRKPSNSLAPGFRFHPTDEELVWYYLKRKVSGKSLRFEPITEIDIYKSEPWDLPDKSKLKNRDLEWYFFSVLDKKYGNGAKTNRATEKGYWKTTGKDRQVFHGSRDVGMKKTLVYHQGRAPRGERTNWVMHEYRLTDQNLQKAGVVQDAFVLCRVFQKSGSGPKNGEQYGAPFVEEEWLDDDDDVIVLSGQLILADDMSLSGDIDVTNSLHQIVDCIPPPKSFFCAEKGKSNNKEILDGDDQKLLVGSSSNLQLSDHSLADSSVQHGMDIISAKAESTVKSYDDMDNIDINELLDGLYWDASDNPGLGDVQYLETNDLSIPIQTNPDSFDPDFFTFFDAIENQFMPWSSQPTEMGSSINDETFFSQVPTNEGMRFLPNSSEQLLLPADNAETSWLKHMPEAKSFTNDSTLSNIRKATSNILGSIPAPPAFAAEFPSKGASASQTDTCSNSCRSEQMIELRKCGTVNMYRSFGVGEAEDVASCSSHAVASKLVSSSTSWVCSFFSWVLFLSVGFKVGCSIFVP